MRNAAAGEACGAGTHTSVLRAQALNSWTPWFVQTLLSLRRTVYAATAAVLGIE